MTRRKRKHRGDIDGLGKPAPVYLADVFVGRSLLHGIAAEIEHLANDVARMQDEGYAREVNGTQVRELLGLAAGLLRLDAPLTACDCTADELDCPRCQGTRWITSREYRKTLEPTPVA